MIRANKLTQVEGPEMLANLAKTAKSESESGESGNFGEILASL